MSNMTGPADLVEQINKTSQSIGASDSRFGRRLDGFEKSLNELYLKTGCPGPEGSRDATSERKDVVEMCQIRRAVHVAKHEDVEYVPPSSEVEEAIYAQKALSQYLRHGNMDCLAPEFRKSLSAFSFGPQGNMLLPQANRVLSCLTSPTEMSGLFDKVTISGPSLRFFIDNARAGLGGWLALAQELPAQWVNASNLKLLSALRRGAPQAIDWDAMSDVVPVLDAFEAAQKSRMARQH